MFGNLGAGELLILIVAIALIWVIIKLLKNVSRIESWAIKRSEARFLSESRAGIVTNKKHSKIWWLPFPFALIAVVLYYIISIALVLDISALGIVFIVIALLIHFNPRGSRYVKYEFLVTGTSILSTGFLSLVARFVSDAVRPPTQWWMTRSLDLNPQVVLWVIIIHVIFLLVVQIVFSLWVGPPVTEGKAPSVSSTLRRYFGSVRRLGYGFALFSFSGLTQPLLTAYLTLRYVLVERMSHTPILYLRSFHYVEGPTAFGKIVARVASRYGVLLALVHQTQRPLELHAETRLTERAELANAPDEDWQNWIKEQMLRASAIIIDYSIDTQGLNWELDCAVSLVNSSKILILNNKDFVVHTPSNIWKLEYEMGPEGEEEAREKLNEHLRNLLIAS